MSFFKYLLRTFNYANYLINDINQGGIEMSEAAEARRRRAELRKKKILENSGERLGKILGAPPESNESLANEAISSESQVRHAPAFEGANVAAYSNSVPNGDPGQGNILDILLNAANQQQENSLGDNSPNQAPPSDFVSNFFSKWFWLALGILTYMALASPDYSWMVADSSGSVFSAAFCLHLVLVKLNVVSGQPSSSGRNGMNLDQLLILILPTLGLASQDKIHQFVEYKKHFMSFAEKWSMFYMPFLVTRIYNGLF